MGRLFQGPEKLLPLYTPRLLREKEAQGPVGLFGFWKQPFHRVDTLLGLMHHVTRKTLALEAGAEQKRALRPREVQRAALLLGAGGSVGPRRVGDRERVRGRVEFMANHHQGGEG